MGWNLMDHIYHFLWENTSAQLQRDGIEEPHKSCAYQVSTAWAKDILYPSDECIIHWRFKFCSPKVHGFIFIMQSSVVIREYLWATVVI
jgi:hypothetical protein